MRPFLAMLVLMLGGLFASAAHAPARADVKQASFVLDANTGQVLHEQFADQPRKPASLTKMMTLYIAFGEIEAGRLSYSSKLVVSERAASVAPSKLELAVGDEIELIDAIKALITKSANDMAVAIAERISGSEANFARLMTERARAIGMTSSRFYNASGLPDDRQVTTARDMVTLGLRLQEDFPEHYRLFSLKEFAYRGKVYRTHNTLMPRFPGMDGIKTGYTRASGFNLVSSVRADGKHLVAAVFGGTTAETRNAHMRSLLFHALEVASPVRTRPQLVAAARAAAPPPRPSAQGEAELPWATATAVAPAPPMPAPVPRPARKPSAADVARATTPDAKSKRAPAQKPDPIASVIASTAEPPPKPTPPLQQAAAAPRLDLGALRSEMSGAAARQPSTLGAQAQAITSGRAEAQPVAVRREQAAGPDGVGTSPQSVIAAMSGYEIQIGAFGSSEEAQAKIDAVRGKAGALLAQHQGLARPAMKGERRIFRARFVAFDEAKASKACLELRRLAVDCLVTKAD